MIGEFEALRHEIAGLFRQRKSEGASVIGISTTDDKAELANLFDESRHCRAGEAESGPNFCGGEIIIAVQRKKDCPYPRSELLVEFPRLEKATEHSQVGIVGAAEEEADLRVRVA